jgi:thimet oligopeptidase
VTRELYKQRFQPWTWLEGNKMYASFGHLMGYSSNYYTYMFDKVIALDFFAQFDPEICWAAMRASATARRCSSRAGRSRGARWCAIFWGATRSLRRSAKWLNEEFEVGDAYSAGGGG